MVKKVSAAGSVGRVISMLGSIIILITLEYNRISSQFDLITIRESVIWNGDCSDTEEQYMQH